MTDEPARRDMDRQSRIQRAYLKACDLDVAVVKPGNVSVGHPGHRMEAAQFRRSAEATVSIVCDPGRSLGEAILHSALATKRAVGCNTNLGIILLCVPLAQVGLACDTRVGFEEHVHRLIADCGAVEAQHVFDAIVEMAPAGLGSSQSHDVSERATAGLLEIMRSAEHDRIAWQYANRFADVIGFGTRSFLRALQVDTAQGTPVQGKTVQGKGTEVSAPVVQALYLDFLSEYPDSHIARKHGAYMAEVVRDEARSKREEFALLSSVLSRSQFLEAYDDELKGRDINPGTTADLTVATLFYQLMQQDRPGGHQVG